MPSSDEIEVLNQLNSSRKSFEIRENAPFIEEYAFPTFVFWDDGEAEQLKNSFIDTWRHMKDTYKSGSFLEKTFQQWTYPQ